MTSISDVNGLSFPISSFRTNQTDRLGRRAAAYLEMALDVGDGEPSHVHKLENKLRRCLWKQHEDTNRFEQVKSDVCHNPKSSKNPEMESVMMMQKQHENMDRCCYSLCWPPSRSMACRKQWWSSGVHRRRGTFDRTYCLTAPVLLPQLPILPPRSTTSSISTASESSPSATVKRGGANYPLSRLVQSRQRPVGHPTVRTRTFCMENKKEKGETKKNQTGKMLVYCIHCTRTQLRLKCILMYEPTRFGSLPLVGEISRVLDIFSSYLFES